MRSGSESHCDHISASKSYLQSGKMDIGAAGSREVASRFLIFAAVASVCLSFPYFVDFASVGIL